MRQDHLRDLIQGMSPAEQRHFHLQSSQFVKQKPSLMLGLFQFYASAASSAPRADAQWWAKHSRGGQFAAARHALLHQVLESLSRFHQDRIPGAGFRQGMDHVALLFERGQRVLCERLLRQLQAQAEKLDAPEMRLEVLRWEVRLLRRNPGKNLQAALKSCNAQEERLIQQLQDAAALRALHDEVYHLLVRQQKSPRRKDAHARHSRHPALRIPQRRLSFESKVIRLYVLIFLAQLQEDTAAALRHFAKMLEVWRAHPARQADDPMRYLRTLRAHADLLLEAGQPLAIPPVADEMDDLVARHRLSPTHQLQLSDYLRLRAMGSPLLAHEAPAKLPSIVARFHESAHLLHLTTRMVFWFNFASLHFVTGQFRQCLPWLEEIFQQPDTEAREDIVRFARLLFMAIHIELGNDTLLDDLRRSSARFLARQGGASARERLLMRYMGAIVGAQGRERRTQFERLLAEWDALSPEEDTIGGNEVRAWALAHAQRIPILEAYASL